MLHLGHALQAFGYLMKATFAAIQFQVRLLARLVKYILADGPASVIGNVVAASFGLLVLFQAEEKLGLIARSTVFIQIICRTRRGAG